MLIACSKPESGAALRYFALIASSAGLLAVNRPVKKLLSLVTVAIRAAAAFIHVSWAVIVFAHTQAAVGFSAPLGITQALPPSVLIGVP